MSGAFGKAPPAALLAACALALGACGSGPERPPLEPVAHPPFERLEGMDEGARTALDRQRQALEAKLDDPATPLTELAAAFGTTGQLYHAYDLLAAARPCYENAARLDPQASPWPYQLGLLERQAGDLDAAAGAFERALALRGNDPAAHLRLGEVFLTLGKTAEARQHFEAAQGAGAFTAAARFGLGRAAAAEGDSAEAVEHFEAALEAAPDASAVHYPLALAYRAAGDLAKAREQLEKGGQGGEVPFPDPLAERIEKLAQGASALLRRGSEALLAGRVEEAVELYRRAVAAGGSDTAGSDAGGNADARRNLALALARAGRPAEAVDELRQALAAHPDDVWLHVDLGNSLMAQGEGEEAIASFRHAVELAPALDSAHFSLANALMSAGRWQEAEGHLLRVLELVPNDVRARYQLAMCRYQQGHTAHGLEALWALAREEPDFVPVRRSLASIFSQRGDVEGALAQLRKAVELAPEEVELRLSFATLLQQAGRFAEAAAEWGEVAERSPAAEPRTAQATALVLAGDFAAARGALEAGLEALPGEVQLTHTLARLLATAPDAAVRDGVRARELARQVYLEKPSLEHAETLGMAFAEEGDFAEAVRWQQGLVEQARKMGREDLVRRLQANLERYRRGEAVRVN